MRTSPYVFLLLYSRLGNFIIIIIIWFYVSFSQWVVTDDLHWSLSMFPQVSRTCLSILNNLNTAAAIIIIIIIIIIIFFIHLIIAAFYQWILGWCILHYYYYFVAGFNPPYCCCFLSKQTGSTYFLLPDEFFCRVWVTTNLLRSPGLF